MNVDTLLQIRDLRVRYDADEVLHGINLEIRHREMVGMAGESGSGKSTLALAILNLVHFHGGAASGAVQFNSHNLLNLSEKELRRIRGREIALIFQNASSALNPVARVGSQIRDVIQTHHKLSASQLSDRVAELLAAVQLEDLGRLLTLYPSQLSGGMAQRVVIALALAHNPRLLVCDEPTSNLDVTTQADILALLRKLNDEIGITVLFISHDLAVLAALCKRVAILQRGRIVEEGQVPAIFRNPRHPYTQKLVRSVPLLDRSSM